MQPETTAGQKLLQAAYENLGYSKKLLDATDSPRDVAPEDWIDKGEWLSLAKKVGAEKVFFVKNNPVIVFAHHRSAEPEEQRKRFKEIWNMARPVLLFLASPGELAVYDLTRGPSKNLEDWNASLQQRRLAIVKTVAEVSEQLQHFKCEQIETGRAFETLDLEEETRADKALIDDLRFVRNELTKGRKPKRGLEPEYAHALIGRSIFIRYLEDRGVLIPKYFREVARSNPTWQRILDTVPLKTHADSEMATRLYLRVLSDKDFTYALFEQLAKDFNGDIFPIDQGEKKAVTVQHLETIQGFLRGDPKRENLFFFAYKFDVIPIELISSIYEEFYNTEEKKYKDTGTHYTPPALVEFLLSQVLTEECLRSNPRVLDPACGSGIFLVKAFHRIVRYRRQAQDGRPLSDQDLREILRDQIAGIDINPDAIRVAAFSLYLAFLQYKKPPDILIHLKKGKRLPNLKYEFRVKVKPEQHYNILLAANAFRIESHVDQSDTEVIRRFSADSADVVVGNPPWGTPPQKDKKGRKSLQVALDWCAARGLHVGNKELSQAFIHRAIDLLFDSGCAGMLVSSGVLFKTHPNSRAFRKEWLQSVILHKIVNFQHVRDVFFKSEIREKGSLSPFVSVVFSKTKTLPRNQIIEYWSMKKTAMIEKMQIAVANHADLKLIRQAEALADDLIWKTYWWGNHHDHHFVRALQMETELRQLSIGGQSLKSCDFGRGFDERSGDRPQRKHLTYKLLPTNRFRGYGPIDMSNLPQPPNPVYVEGNLRLYEGLRLLIKRGITQKGHKKGYIVARLATEPFCFRHSIYGIRLPDSGIQDAKVLLGILWSSLARYYFWMTATSWDMWHPEIYLEHIKKMPVRLPNSHNLRKRIIRIVDDLQNRSDEADLIMEKVKRSTRKEITKLENELDKAIFDLYGFTEAERDLVKDMCEVGLNLFYKGPKSKALKPLKITAREKTIGTADDLTESPTAVPNELRDYLLAFLQYWNRELQEEEGEFSWQIICPGGKFLMLAVVFATKSLKEPLPEINNSDEKEWASVLKRLEKTSMVPFGSRQVYVEGLVRSVSDTEIIIIKRNEKRLWTASMAREDAEATLLQAIHLQRAKRT